MSDRSHEDERATQDADFTTRLSAARDRWDAVTDQVRAVLDDLNALILGADKETRDGG